MELSDAKQEEQQEAQSIHHQYVALLKQREAVAGKKWCSPGTPRVGL